jgi:hypothetical protein
MPTKTGRVRWMLPAIAAVALLALIALYLAFRRSDLGGSAMRAGLEDHVQCAIRGKSEIEPYPLERGYAGLAEVAKLIPEGYQVAAAHHCSQSGRRFAHVVMQSERGPVSLIVSDRLPGETLASRGTSQMELSPGLSLSEGRAEPYEVSAFETPSHLAFVVSSLPRETNRGIMRRIALDVRSLLNLFKKEGRLPEKQPVVALLPASFRTM